MKICEKSWRMGKLKRKTLIVCCGAWDGDLSAFGENAACHDLAVIG